MNKQSVFKIILTSLIGFFLFIGGLGVGAEKVRIFGAVLGVVIVATPLFIKTKLQLPKGFFIYLIFLAAACINLFLLKKPGNHLGYLFNLAIGGIYWLGFYNIGPKLKIPINKLIVGLGIVFAVIFFVSLAAGSRYQFLSFALPSIERFSHQHIADFWAVALIVVVFWAIKKAKLWHIILMVLGIFILAISLSRSAIIALVVGLFFVFSKSKIGERSRNIIKRISILAILLFLFMGLAKTTLFSRVYYLQAFDGFWKNPLGVGLGNFIEISRKSPYAMIDGRYFVASMTHNLLLEILVGIGVFSLIFVVWLIKVIREVIGGKSALSILYGALFLTIFANFFFDYTYLNISFFWLWFAILGLAQRNKVET